MNQLYPYILIIMILFVSCKTNKCSSFFTYKATKIDIKGISKKLKKNGAETLELNVGSILIDPKFTQATEELQRLDLLQKTLCEQLSLISDDSTRNTQRVEYISTLISMIKIAQRPDSNIVKRLTELETSEEKRVKAEKQFYDLKRTPPNADFILTIDEKGEFVYLITILNDVPFRLWTLLSRYDGVHMNGKVLHLEYPEFNPNKGKKWIFPADRNINDDQLPTQDTFRLKASITYFSVYANEINSPELIKTLYKYYFIDRKKRTVTEIKE